jgi:hypothetical protein
MQKQSTGNQRPFIEFDILFIGVYIFGMKKGIFILVIICVLASSREVFSQLTPEEVAQRPMWEVFLKTAKIVKGESVGEGVTKPRRLLLKKGTTEAYAAWKRPIGIGAGTDDKWECEIAAYRMDKLLGLNMVPPTVERSYRLDEGSLQFWMTIPISELSRKKDDIPVPADKLENYEKMRSLQRAFDSLIGNSDRSLQNLRYTEDWRMILIDHSRAFRDYHPYVKTLIYGKKGIKAQEFGRLPRGFVEKVRSLNFDQIRRAVEYYLTESEIKAVLFRKGLLLKEIDEMIKEKSEEAVLY